MYAKYVRRMNKSKKFEAEIQAEMFAEEIGHKFIRIEKEYKGAYVAVFESETEEIGASVVTCPHCEEIQVCYGDYGDPATEICVCTNCHNVYECEPF